MSTAKPAVSVVVTCFNYGRYVAACLESVLAQTYQDFEVVVVDDGSTDDSAEIITRFLSDGRVRLIRQANGGQAKAKNVGVAASSAELVAFLDADDLWEPQKLERQCALFSEPAVGVVYSRATYLDHAGRPATITPHGPHLTPRRGDVTSYLFFDNFVPFSSSVFRRTALEGRPPFDESLQMGIDWDLWLRTSVKYRFDFVDAPLMHYRVGHPDQMSRNLEVRQECSDRIMRRFVEAHPGAVSQRTVRHAWAYTHLVRGIYFRERDRRRARRHLREAICLRPLQIYAYKELVRSGLLALRRAR